MKLSIKRLVLAVALVLTGYVAIIVGLVAIFWPAALILGGVMLLAAGAFAVRVVSVDEEPNG